MKTNAAVLVLLLAAGCASDSSQMTGDTRNERSAPPMDPQRKVSEQDCSRGVDISATGNLMCKGEPTAEERERLAEEERQLRLAAERRARLEAEERAARERAERERAERLAREEAERKARAAEEERLAAERKAREERERIEAEARARQRAEQEAREAAERERQRLEQEWLAGRAALENFVATYGKAEPFKEIAEQINAFLEKTRNLKR